MQFIKPIDPDLDLPREVKERTISISLPQLSWVQQTADRNKSLETWTNLEGALLCHQIAEAIGDLGGAHFALVCLDRIVREKRSELDENSLYELIRDFLVEVYNGGDPFTVTDFAVVKSNALKYTDTGSRESEEPGVYPLSERKVVLEAEAEGWAGFYTGATLLPEKGMEWLQRSLDKARSHALMYRAAELLGSSLLQLGCEERAVTCFRIQEWAANFFDSEDMKVASMHNVFKALAGAERYAEAAYVVSELEDIVDVGDGEQSKGGFIGVVVLQMKAELYLGVHKYFECHTNAVECIVKLETLPGSWREISTPVPEWDCTPARKMVLAECLDSAWTCNKRALLCLGDVDAAAQAHERWLGSCYGKKDELGAAENLRFVAAMQLRRQEFQDAETTALKLVELCNGLSDVRLKADALILKGKVLASLQNPDAGVAALQEVDNIYKLSDPHHKAKVATLLGDMYYDSKDLHKAVSMYEKYLRTTLVRMDDNFASFSAGRISHTGYTATPIFRKMQLALIKLGQAKRAILWAERERARDLIYRMVDINLDDPSPAFDMEDDAAWMKIESILKTRAGSKTAVLVFTVFEENIISYFLRPDQEVLCNVGDEALSLRHYMDKFRSLMARKRKGPVVGECLQELHRLLIEPWSEALETSQTERLVIVPTEMLSLVPFAALQDEDEIFLVQKYIVSYAPSLRLYDLCCKRHEALLSSIQRHNVLVVGNPDGSLEFAEKEAEIVADKFIRAGANKVDVFLKESATADEVLERLSRCSWAHIASHGIVNEQFPQGGILVHEPSQGLSLRSLPEDRATQFRKEYKKGNVLTGRQIQTSSVQLFLSAVVLSACDTGLGEICSEGTLGLCRTFHGSGVPAVVVSLWKVDDEATHKLMGVMYTQLCRGVDTAAALQFAMKQMVEDEDCIQDVVEWAPFIVSGGSNGGFKSNC